MNPLDPEPDRPPLRLGLLVDDLVMSSWQRKVLEELGRWGDTEVIAVAVNAGADHVRRPRRSSGNRFIWRFYNNRWVARRSSAVAKSDCRDLVKEAEVRSVTPTRRGRYSLHLSDADVRWLESLDLDIVLRFGFGILRGEVLEIPKHGVWSFHHDDERVVRGGPPSFWEVHDGLPTTGVLLQRLTDRLDGGVPIGRATFRTVKHSYPRNRDRVSFGAACLPARCARAIRLGSFDMPAGASPSEAPLRRDPTNRQMVGFLLRQSVGFIRSQWQGITQTPTWSIGRVLDERDQLALLAGGHPEEISWFDPGDPDVYLADPFTARRDGQDATLVEEFDERLASGVISAVVHSDDGDELVSTVIDVGAHASYPYMFEFGSDLYCVPEIAALGRIELWRSVLFPVSWVRDRILIDGVAAVDPTIFEWEGRWWLLAGNGDAAPDSELLAWWADTPLGPWTEHPMNPIKIDVTSARPAGTPFVLDGQLIRPAQDCAEGYGTAVALMQVKRLDPSGFEELQVGRITGAHLGEFNGTHTLSRVTGPAAVDARQTRFNRHRAVREVRARLPLVGRRRSG